MSVSHDLVIVGAGPAALVAALRARAAGLSVLLLEKGGPSSQVPLDQWFDMDRTAANLRNRGLCAPTPPARLAIGLPEVLGGGFAANSGLYCWPSAATLSAWAPVLSSADLDVGRAYVESMLPLVPAPASTSSMLLRATATSLALPAEDLRTWLRDPVAPDNPLLTECLAQGVQVRTATEVVAIERDGSLRSLRLADGSRQPARAVLLAAGVFGSYSLAAASGLTSGPAVVAGHPMLRSVLFPIDPVLPLEPLPGRVQVVHSETVRSGSALSRPWALAANHPEVVDRMRVLWADHRYPFGWYTQVSHPAVLRLSRTARRLRVVQVLERNDPLLREAAAAHWALLRAGADHRFAFAGTPWYPFAEQDLLRNPRLSMVHLAASLPLGTALAADGSFPSDSLVGCVDSSTLPTSPGVNPQAVVMALAAVLAARFIESLPAARGGSR